MGAIIKVKQVKGLQSTLDALVGIDKVSEIFTTTATDGDTGILISQSARETDAIQVFVNGQKLQEGYSWKKGGSVITASSLEASTELVWDASTAGFDLEATDEVQIEYETLTSGNTLQGNSGISGTITGNLIPDTNEVYDLGSANFKFKDIYMSGNTLYMGGQPLSITNGALTLNGNPVTGSVDTYNSTKASEGQLTTSTILSTTNTNDKQGWGAKFSPTLDRVLVLDGDIVKVFRLTNNTWQQEGQDIQAAPSMSIDFDNSRVRWSADGNHFILSTVGNTVRNSIVYFWNGTQWQQRGNEIADPGRIVGAQNYTGTGARAHDINANGTRISIQREIDGSSPPSDVDGWVSVFDYDANSNQWINDTQSTDPVKYHNMDNQGEYLIADEDSGSSSSRRIHFLKKETGVAYMDVYSNVNFQQVYTGSNSGFISGVNTYTLASYNRRGDFSGDDNIVALRELNTSYTDPNTGQQVQNYSTIKFMIKRPDANQPSTDNWWVSSVLDPMVIIGIPNGLALGTLYCFSMNFDGSRALVHGHANGVSNFTIWDRSGTPGNYSWSLVLGPIQTVGTTGFTANSDLTKVIAESSTDSHVLYNIPASLPVNSISANRILDTTALSVGSQFQLQFDEGLAYASVQTCHVYIDYNNRIHARVVSNDANTNTLTLEVIELVGGGISDEYTITLG